MPKSTNRNQHAKSSANDAKLKPVSKAVRNRMARLIQELNDEPYHFTYEQISAAMGHESGYAHLIQHGGRVSPTKIEAQALEAMYIAATRNANQLRSSTDRRVKIIGLAAQIQREVNEL